MTCHAGDTASVFACDPGLLGPLGGSAVALAAVAMFATLPAARPYLASLRGPATYFRARADLLACAAVGSGLLAFLAGYYAARGLAGFAIVLLVASLCVQFWLWAPRLTTVGTPALP